MEIIRKIKNIKPITKGTVAIWGAYVPDCRKKLKSLYKILSKQEQSKANAFYNHSHQEVSILARGALRILLGIYMDIDPKNLSFLKTSFGKPFIKNKPYSFNVSHSQDWIIIAIGLENSIGVDLEAIRPDVDIYKISTRYFSSEEQSALKKSDQPRRLFFDLWSYKESILKAKGGRLLTSIKSINIPLHKEQVLPQCCINEWNLYKIEAGSRYSAALAVNTEIINRPCYDFKTLEWEL